MNKKVSLVIIQKPDIKISNKNFLLNKEGKVVRFENDQQDDLTPIEYYFVDDQPIKPSNQYIYYEEGPKKKTCTEIDYVIRKGKFLKGERRIYPNSNLINWVYVSDTKTYEPFKEKHINLIIDKGFSCFIKEKNNECNGETCLNCDCYEYDEKKFEPEIYQNSFVIVI